MPSLLCPCRFSEFLKFLHQIIFENLQIFSLPNLKLRISKSSPWCRWLDGGATTTLRWILAVMNSDQVLKGTWSEGIRYLKDGIRYLDRSKIATDYLDRSKIGAMQIRWHLESSFSCMNYRSDDGKTSVSVGFYSCLGRLQSLSSDLSRMEFARNVQNTSTKRESRTLSLKHFFRFLVRDPAW